jgi:3-oxoacyl-[acyl-carrier-protein] synthase-1
MPQFAELGLRSQVAGVPEIDLEALIDRKQLRFMGDAAAYAHIALTNAIAHAGLTPEQVSHPRTGLIMGSGGGSPANQIESADVLRSKGIRRVGPYQVTRCMSSTVSACLCTNFGIKGINYSITSACSTSAHCIGAAAQQIAFGLAAAKRCHGVWACCLMPWARCLANTTTHPKKPRVRTMPTAMVLYCLAVVVPWC